jgi:hypothetical protein
MMRKGYLLLAVFLLVIPGISQGATIYSGSLTDAYSGTYILEVTDDGAGDDTYSATLTVITNDLNADAYIDWFAVHFDTPGAVITSVIAASTGTWLVGDGNDVVEGYGGPNTIFPTDPFTGGFEVGIDTVGVYDENDGFKLDGGTYSWAFDFTSDPPILGELGTSDPNLQVGFYGEDVNGNSRLSETFSVPEASALVLLSTGLVGLVMWRRKKRFE